MLRGIYLVYSDSTTITNINSASNGYGHGLYIYYSDLTKIEDSVFKNNGYYDIYLETTNDFNHEFINVNGTEDKPIVYYNSSVTIENWYNNVSEIILGNADNSVLNNITIDRNGTENNGIILVETDSSNLTNINVRDLASAIFLV